MVPEAFLSNHTVSYFLSLSNYITQKAGKEYIKNIKKVAFLVCNKLTFKNCIYGHLNHFRFYW